MEVEVSVDMGRTTRKIAELARNEGLGAFISTEAAKGMDPYVPMRDGDLSDSADTSRPFHVVYGGAASSYAGIVYTGIREGKPIRIHKDKHPKATKEWDGKWYAEKGDDFRRSVLTYIETRLL